MKTREWLRTLLHLDERAASDGVPEADVNRQEDTVLRALEMLEERPGVVLADEVGMGKTFEALGVIAAVRQANPKAKTMILTPGPELSIKWKNEIGRFISKPAIYPFEGVGEPVRKLSELVTSFKEHQIVIASSTVFGSGRDANTQSYLLSLFFEWKKLPGQTISAAFRRFDGGKLTRVDVKTSKFLDDATLEQLEPHLETAFAGTKHGHPTLDALWAESGLAGFDRTDYVKQALSTARYRLVRALLPHVDLLVIDEAHKLKNAETTKARSVANVFDGKFDKALFLTATPFQLDVSELRQVFRLFSLAKGAPSTLMADVEGLFTDIRDYQEAYGSFEAAWHGADPETVARFQTAYTDDPSLRGPFDDPSLQEVASRARRLLELKTTKIEPAFRAWMIRSVREDMRSYRDHQRTRQAGKGARIPFLLYERFLAELFRSGERTHKASVEINMVSSYGAASEGALLSSDKARFKGDLEKYRVLLRDVVTSLRHRGQDHPKMQFVLQDALDAIDRGEKTLIFCERNETLRELANSLEEAWRDRLLIKWSELYAGATHEDIWGSRAEGRREEGRHGALRKRLHGSNDSLYLALRERYAQSLLQLGEWPLEHLEPIVERANAILVAARRAGEARPRLDYRVAKRCLERATAEIYRETEGSLPNEDEIAWKAITNAEFVKLGLDLEADDLEGVVDDDEDPERRSQAPEWTLSADVARLVLAPSKNLWSLLSGHLSQFDFALRVRVTERLARYLTNPDVPFLVEVLRAAARAGQRIEGFESRSLLTFIDAFWTTPEGRVWVDRLRAFLEFFLNRDPVEQRQTLDGPFAKTKLVRHTEDADSREGLRDAFNTPLYPMILVAGRTMQEGVDLHRSCRRVVHHDLAWNPAQLEQRVGRVDRLGSRTAQLRHRQAARHQPVTVKLDVLYPLVANTVDERIYRAVKGREKWLEFLLGAAPKYDEFSLEDTPPPPLPEDFAQALRINLKPAP